MKPTVDQDLCIGCGLCAQLAPDVFELDGDLLSRVIADPGPFDEPAVQEAADSCPSNAITIG